MNRRFFFCSSLWTRNNEDNFCLLERVFGRRAGVEGSCRRLIKLWGSGFVFVLFQQISTVILLCQLFISCEVEGVSSQKLLLRLFSDSFYSTFQYSFGSGASGQISEGFVILITKKVQKNTKNWKNSKKISKETLTTVGRRENLNKLNWKDSLDI